MKTGLLNGVPYPLVLRKDLAKTKWISLVSGVRRPTWDPPGLSQSVKGVDASHAGNKRVISERALRKERIEHEDGGVEVVGRVQIEKYMCDWFLVQVCLQHKSVYNQYIGHSTIVLHAFQ